MVGNREVIRLARVNVEKSDSTTTAAASSVEGSVSLQARWFISLEMRVTPAKKEALQALSISKNVAWNAFTFRF
jgi:hypothetical protein